MARKEEQKMSCGKRDEYHDHMCELGTEEATSDKSYQVAALVVLAALGTVGGYFLRKLTEPKQPTN